MGNRVAAPLLAGLIPFVAFFALGLNYFYVNGAMWGDGGILASLIWHQSWALRSPAVFGGQSFLSTHMVPAFWLISALSWLLPFSRVQFFALFLGAVQALMALSVYQLLTRLDVRPWRAASLAALFAFNGIVLAASCNPHFELLIPASGMAFFAALACGQNWRAWLFFALCLLTREDAGVHLGLLLLAGAAGLYWQGVAPTRLRPLLIYAALALTYSALCVTAQHTLFPNAPALQGVYLGTPPFNRLTPALLATRLTFYVLYRLYLVLPFIAALILAERWKMPFLAAGFAACLPWLGLNWLAASSYAGTLSNYYSFPLIFGLFWPLAGQVFAETYGAPRLLSRHQALTASTTLLAASFVGLWALQDPQQLHFPGSFFTPPSLASQHAAEQALAAFRHAPLGRVAVTGSIIALDPDHYTQAQLVWRQQSMPPDTIIFFPQGQDTNLALKLAAQAGLKHFYQVPGTALCLATNQTLDAQAFSLASLTPP